MKDSLLRFFFKRYKHDFEDLFVEEMVGAIPKDIREPSVTFLANGKEVLTRFFLFQSYVLQRRAVSDIEGVERYHGMLVMLKYLMLLISESDVRTPEKATSPEKVKTDVTIGVEEFLTGMKSLTKEKK